MLVSVVGRDKNSFFFFLVFNKLRMPSTSVLLVPVGGFFGILVQEVKEGISN